MPTRSKVYRVMIGSPSDLAEERQAATDAVNEWTVVTSVTLRRGAFALAVAARATPKAEFRSSDGIQEYARVARASLESREMVDSDAAGVA
jgi:hypothetical protein